MEADNRRVKAECEAITILKIYWNPLTYFLLIHQVDQLQNWNNHEIVSLYRFSKWINSVVTTFTHAVYIRCSAALWILILILFIPAACIETIIGGSCSVKHSSIMLAWKGLSSLLI
jgi:hypothetical protein